MVETNLEILSLLRAEERVVYCRGPEKIEYSVAPLPVSIFGLLQPGFDYSSREQNLRDWDKVESKNRWIYIHTHSQKILVILHERENQFILPA